MLVTHFQHNECIHFIEWKNGSHFYQAIEIKPGPIKHVKCQ